jgi:hypothetical protein
MTLSLKNITGPVRYEKVVLRLREVPYVMHFFSDDHIRTTSCDTIEKSIDLHKLVVDTITIHKTTDIIYEGTDRQKSIAGNYLREFRTAFPNRCWENHTCDTFPDTIFHSVDIRGIINTDWMREISRIKHSLEMDEIHRFIPKVKAQIRFELKRGGSVPQQLLRAWMDSLLSISGRLAMSYQELAEDWVLWICKGRPMDTVVEHLLISQSIIPISYDKYILNNINTVSVLYQPYLDKWLEQSYQMVMDNPHQHATILLAFIVDLATVRVLLSLSNPYAIVYMGHQHTWAVLHYLKQLSEDNVSISYTNPSFQSMDTPNGNPIQCLRIPLESGVLSMDESC